METKIPALKKLSENKFCLSKEFKPGMRVDGIIYTNEKLLPSLLQDKALEQVANVAFLPGIIKHSLAMPDIHWGYGFPIGGVAATDIGEGGVVSPGGVGFDINCGVRLVKTGLFQQDIEGKLTDLVNLLYHSVPAGVGSKGSLKLTESQEKALLIKGAKWVVEQGYGTKDDLECTEENGCMKDVDPGLISQYAYQRGRPQVGTLGSGNHFLEIQVIDKIFDEKIAEQLNLFETQVVVMIHSGSRGFGHQVCSDYLKTMQDCPRKYNIKVPDRQLACAPVESKEGKAYLSAMGCAANYAWANRQLLMHKTREVFEKFLKVGQNTLKMNLIYDVAHNIAKTETYLVNGVPKKLCVHRKGATRAFGPGRQELPEKYRNIGQPVIIPGDMGRNSYLLVGTEQAMQETFGSTCHGAGRLQSRTQAIHTLDRNKVLKELKDKGIEIRSTGKETICEEAPQAYKDVNDIVEIVHNAGISKKVCRMKPVGVIKG
ncbi:MAG: RtcB family protein [Candidatus Omnitrophica bacterium]|nr:RtcB family protein [Candidatus Omnitrophota bacterium]